MRSCDDVWSVLGHIFSSQNLFLPFVHSARKQRCMQRVGICWQNLPLIATSPYALLVLFVQMTLACCWETEMSKTLQSIGPVGSNSVDMFKPRYITGIREIFGWQMQFIKLSSYRYVHPCTIPAKPHVSWYVMYVNGMATSVSLVGCMESRNQYYMLL